MIEPLADSVVRPVDWDEAGRLSAHSHPLKLPEAEHQQAPARQSTGGWNAHVDAPWSELRLAQPFPRLPRLSATHSTPPFSHTLNRALKTTSRTAP